VAELGTLRRAAGSWFGQDAGVGWDIVQASDGRWAAVPLPATISEAVPEGDIKCALRRLQAMESTVSVA
jgi:hypothetical protein